MQYQSIKRNRLYSYKSNEERFWALVEKTASGCWLWKGAQLRGYGQFYVRLDGRTYRHVYAHRYAYQLTTGTIPEGLQLDHLCRITLCVNPAHLEPVTSQENLRRSRVAHGLDSFCHRGHPRTSETIAYFKGNLFCRACRREDVRTGSCLDCGTIIQGRSKRCRMCAGLARKGRPRTKVLPTL